MSAEFNGSTFQGRIGKVRAGPEKRDWLLLVCFLIASTLVFGLAEYFVDRAERRSFDAMTPAQHLEASRVALRQGRIGDGLRHVSAVAVGTPEFLQVRSLKEKLEGAKEAERQRIAEARESAQLAEQGRKTSLRDLENNLKNLGYDLMVAQSDKPDEVVITSKDFDDTDHRVRFLSFLRSRDSPAAQACLAGFQTVHLKGGSIFGFSETYPMDCFNWR